MSNSNIKKYKYTGKVLTNVNPNILIYLSNGEVKDYLPGDFRSPKEGLVEVKHYVSGDVGYWSEEQFKKWFKPL